ncbi:MAG: hypothetical protein A2Y25_03380 [Candidatus Melainabacteria bacterium GWF2_37_15]|nr:MAG: hypothetical protein A2Y25_03380 [Candidatus Melainabacteria bacterium GWF2_37_15]
MPDKAILDKILAAILKVIVPDKVILFGSQARGTARPDSDYDILVIKSGIENERKINQAIYRVMVDIDIPIGVDVIVKTPENVEKNKKMTFSVVKEALEEGIVIYG